MDVNKSDIIMRVFYQKVNRIDWSSNLGRLIKTGSAGKDRLLFEKGIVLAIHELTRQTGMDDSTRDLLAYIALSLNAISETIDKSVGAWEKRGYWVKADRYRMEWTWAANLGGALKEAILIEDWANAVNIIGQVTQKLSAVKIAQKNRMGSPWVGSYKKLISPK
jgi:hypothetical protein